MPVTARRRLRRDGKGRYRPTKTHSASIGSVLIQHIQHTQDFPSLPSRQTLSTKWPRPDADAAQPCQPADLTIVVGRWRLLAD